MTEAERIAELEDELRQAHDVIRVAYYGLSSPDAVARASRPWSQGGTSFSRITSTAVVALDSFVRAKRLTRRATS